MKKIIIVFVFYLSLYSLTSNSLDKREKGLVDRDTFFQHVIGVPEHIFQVSDSLKKESISWNKLKNAFFLQNQSTGKQFRAGKFTAFTIDTLRKLTSGKTAETSGSFNVIEALNPLGKPYYRHVDIGANQADINNRDAVFQVASNFNALELVGSTDPMNDITGYIGDLTQGPFASISAAPGTILRHYYMFYNPHSDPSTWQQYPIIGRLWQKSDAAKQLNLLENTDIPVVNSYVAFSKRSPENVSHYDVKDIEIGWHEGIQVTSGFMPTSRKHTLIDDPEQIINQVFTAAVDFGSNSGYRNNKQAIAIAQAVQDAAYEGTIRAAAAFGKKKVYLSLIGGGVFYNKLAWIANALEKMKEFIITSGLEVTLIIFDGNDYRLADQIDDFRARMQQLVHQTSGKYLQYSPSHQDGKLLVKTEKPAVRDVQNLSFTLQTLSQTLQQLEKVL